MNTRTTLIATTTLAIALVSGTAHSALQGRDLNGSAGSFEAYYDTVLDITWLADANYGAGSSFDNVGINGGSTTDGKMTWLNANAWAANLSFTDGVNVYDNWRLPTVNPVNGSTFNYASSYNGSTDYGVNISKAGTAYAGSTASELAYMFYNTLGNQGYLTPTSAWSGCMVSSVDTCLDNVGPFSNLQPNAYWSATAYAPYTSDAWYFYTADGGQLENLKSYAFYAWAVSPGDVAAVPEADTWAMLLAGLGLIGVATRRRKLAKV